LIDIKPMEKTMRASDLPEVRHLKLFESMREDSFADLMRAAYLQSFPAHVQLITEGEAADFLFVMVEGCAELFAKSNGRETTMGMVHPFGTFILAAVLRDAVYLMSARTVEKSRILKIPSENIRDVFEQDEAFARALVVELANCYRGVVKDLKDLKLRTGVERLAGRLLKYHSEQGGRGELQLPYDKRTLAALLGMTPENISRAFATLKPYGVAVDGSRVRLADVPALEVLAKPNPLIDDRLA
jgi:CRP/FNR family transcriptional activator FtrB